MTGRRYHGLLAAAALVATVRTQEPQLPAPAGMPDAPGLLEAGPQGPRGYEAKGAYEDFRIRDDYRELQLFGGFWFRVPSLQLEVRGRNAVLLADAEEAQPLFQPQGGDDRPRRGLPPPDPRRRLTLDTVRERLRTTLSALGSRVEVPSNTESGQALDLLRYLYFEGGIVVTSAGVEVLRCERLWISPVDDRIVVEDAELHYRSPGAAEAPTLIVRGGSLVKQGSRWTGRDLLLTTCSAAVPHAAAAVGEAEIIERPGEFEVISRGQVLQIGGTSVMPLPDAHLFTGSQSEFPIRSAGVGYSNREGYRARLVIGTAWNRTGGAIHNWLTGRPAEEFRGEWDLGVGWIQRRGAPLTGELRYRAGDLYEGRTNAFWIDDGGQDFREITTDIRGVDVPEGSRGIVASQNRVHLGAGTHADLQLFRATDEAVWSEFRRMDYRSEELPETSAYLHHRDGNHLFTVGTRNNLDTFSYRDNRALARRFTEELPVVTYHRLAEPIADTPWGAPILVDLGSELSQRRSDYDDQLGAEQVGDRTLRADQFVEVSAPFHLGVANLRPYFHSRGTWYDRAADGRSEGRVALEGGLQLGTRLSRTWRWNDGDSERSVRHVIAPKVTWSDRFHVDDDSSEFRQFAETEELQPDTLLWFDATDRLTERQLFRFELRNLLQHGGAAEDPRQLGANAREFVLLDLAQDWWPRAGRDNGGDELGLFYYDLLLRPRRGALPLDTFLFAVYGDHDWDDGMRTLDTELMFGKVAGVTWTVEYREDRLVDGAVGLRGATRLFDRWDLFAGSQRDITNDEWLSWSMGIVRLDHDWTISLVANYDPFTDTTGIQLDFQPRMPMFGGRRYDPFGTGAFVDNMATRY